MPDAETARSDARVLLLSQRNIAQSIWLGGPNEFEDVICEVDNVRTVAPRAHNVTGFRQLGRGLTDRTRARLGLRRKPHTEVVEVDGDYDLFFVALASAAGLPYLQQLRGWRARCRMAVCFIFEQWLPMVEKWRPHLELLRDFDRVFVFSRWSIPAMQEIAQRPVQYLDGGIDTEAFCPYPTVPPRMIDVYSIGRRSPATHAALFRAMKAEQLTYIYDTVSFGELVIDYAVHRPLVRHLMKRSRYFLAYRVGDSPTRAHWGGEDALPLRYFEGAAAGTVMLGTISKSEDYGRLFDWPDATIEIPYEAPEIMEILAALDADPERLARARRNNVINSLRRHDWVYRWRDILDAMGLAHPSGMRARIARLEHLADLASDSADRGGIDRRADRRQLLTTSQGRASGERAEPSTSMPRRAISRDT